jgi:HPt (histidine-containing phosphotransfer) domain-containing protein
MTTSESEKSNENVCDLKYLTEMMGSKKNLIKGIMDAFLEQVPDELKSINDAIPKADYASIKVFSHTMKSSVSIMGVSKLTPILQEMEDLANKATDIEKIIELNEKLNLICKQAIEEIKRELPNYA